MEDKISNQDKTTGKEKIPVSACGCDTDHHNGVFISTEYQGKRIYFCAQDCKEEFIEDPAAFLNSDHFLIEFETLEDI